MQNIRDMVISIETPVVVRELARAKSATAIAPIMVKFLQRMDSALSAVSPRLACEKGCSYCCHYHVYIYPVEALILAEFIKKLDVQNREVIQERLRDNLTKIAGLTVDQHIATNVQCALLGDDGKCIGYEFRPLACRKYHSVDGISCKIAFDDTSLPMQNMVSSAREVIGSGFIASLVKASHAVGVDTLLYEMNGALAEALSNTACIKRWKDVKVTFPSVRDRCSLTA